MRNADVLQEASLASGLIAAQTGLPTVAYAERAMAAQSIINAADAAADYVAQNNDVTPDVAANNSNFFMKTAINVGVGVAATMAMPAFAPVITAIGAGQMARDAGKSLSASNETEFKSFADENDGQSYEAPSTPTNAELSKQQAPVMLMTTQTDRGSFADSVDQSVEERGAQEVYAELTTGKTRIAAEGQLAFSMEQLEQRGVEFDTPKPQQAQQFTFG